MKKVSDVLFEEIDKLDKCLDSIQIALLSHTVWISVITLYIVWQMLRKKD